MVTSASAISEVLQHRQTPLILTEFVLFLTLLWLHLQVVCVCVNSPSCQKSPVSLAVVLHVGNGFANSSAIC